MSKRFHPQRKQCRVCGRTKDVKPVRLPNGVTVDLDDCADDYFRVQRAMELVNK